MKNLKESKVWVTNIKKNNFNMIDVKFECEGNFKEKDIRNFVEESVNQTIEILKNSDLKTYISVFLTNNKEIRKINFKFRNIDKETNVLSFPQNEERVMIDLENYLILGDIVISLEKILAESKEREKSFYKHLLHMIVHSTLHLYGYDHTNKKEADIMEEKEKDVLNELFKRKNFKL